MSLFESTIDKVDIQYHKKLLISSKAKADIELLERIAKAMPTGTYPLVSVHDDSLSLFMSSKAVNEDQLLAELYVSQSILDYGTLTITPLTDIDSTHIDYGFSLKGINQNPIHLYVEKSLFSPDDLERIAAIPAKTDGGFKRVIYGFDLGAGDERTLEVIAHEVTA